MKSDLKAIRIKELRSMTGLRSNLPDMPVYIVVQEAADLYEWCRNDRETLIKAGLDWKYAEDLPVRAEVLITLQSAWSMEHMSMKECQIEWKVALPQARNMRNELLHHFFHAFYSIPDAHAQVKRISNGDTRADMIQDLFDLAELGNKHRSKLESIGMDTGILDKARQTATELNALLTRVQTVVRESSEGQILRNKAYYYLKEAVGEVRRVGRYAFWKEKKRYKGYVSAFMQRKNQKHRKKKG